MNNNFNIMENELSLRQIMAVSLKVFFKNIILISALILIIFVPICIAVVIINIQQLDIIASLGDTEQLLNLLYSTDQATIEKMISVMQSMAQRGVILLFIMFFFEPLGKMGVAYITKQVIFGVTPVLSLALEKTFASWKTLFFATIFYTFFLLTSCTLIFFPAVLFGNFFLVLIPVVFFSVIFYFYSFAIILSNKREVDSLRYSFLLIRKRWVKAFIFICVFTFFKYLIYVLSGLLLPTLKIDFVFLFIQNIIASLLSSYFYICSAVWYLNLDCIENGGVYFDKSV